MDPPHDVITNTNPRFSRKSHLSQFVAYQQSATKLSKTCSRFACRSSVNVLPIQKDPAYELFTDPTHPFRRLRRRGWVNGGRGVIFLIAFLEDEIRDPEEITRKWGVPVLGLIMAYKLNGNAIITMSKPRAPVSESYRSLRTNLQFSSVDHPIKTLLVTSASPSDGKTSVVANLATIMAQTDKEVVVVDADLRKPEFIRSYPSHRLDFRYFILPLGI